MLWKRSVIGLVAAQTLLAATVMAQELSTPPASFAEFGRASGGEIQSMIKRPSQFSGSFGLTSGRSSASLGGSGKTYGATLGGTLLKDRIWFFGTAERTAGLRIDPALSLSAGRGPATFGYGTMSAQLGDRQSLFASTGREASLPATLPASFLSLHYTGIVSSNMFFTARVSRQSSTPTQPGIMTPGQTP